jgi:hypothetical protein
VLLVIWMILVSLIAAVFLYTAVIVVSNEWLSILCISCSILTILLTIRRIVQEEVKFNNDEDH